MSDVALTASVCPHDTAKNLTTWIEFFLVLGQTAGLEIGYLHAADFPEFYERFGEVQLVYANPLDALRIEDERGFLPLATTDRYDEVVFVAREGAARTLADFADRPLAMVEGQFATLLGCTLLQERGVQVGPLRPYPSWGEALAALRQGEVEHALLYKDFFEQLSELSLEGVQVVEVSDARSFGHVLMLHPDYAAHRTVLLEALARLPDHPLGAMVLADLRIGSWREVASTEFLRSLLSC